MEGKDKSRGRALAVAEECVHRFGQLCDDGRGGLLFQYVDTALNDVSCSRNIVYTGRYPMTRLTSRRARLEGSQGIADVPGCIFATCFFQCFLYFHPACHVGRPELSKALQSSRGQLSVYQAAGRMIRHYATNVPFSFSVITLKMLNEMISPAECVLASMTFANGTRIPPAFLQMAPDVTHENSSTSTLGITETLAKPVLFLVRMFP